MSTLKEIRIENIIRMLSNRAMTAIQVAEEMEICENTARNYINIIMQDYYIQKNKVVGFNNIHTYKVVYRKGNVFNELPEEVSLNYLKEWAFDKPQFKGQTTVHIANMAKKNGTRVYKIRGDKKIYM